MVTIARNNDMIKYVFIVNLSGKIVFFSFIAVCRRNGANIGVSLLQGIFHVFNCNLRGIEDRGIGFTAVSPPLVYSYDTFSPVQGVFADVVSADDKRCFL
jgi:hypothetical protein